MKMCLNICSLNSICEGRIFMKNRSIKLSLMALIFLTLGFSGKLIFAMKPKVEIKNRSVEQNSKTAKKYLDIKKEKKNLKSF